MRVLNDTTLVGLLIDQKLRWGPMVDKLAVKARQRVGALARVRHLLDSCSIQMIYSMFIRSILEYSSVCWMGAAPTHLAKLDRVQATAERIGGFQSEPLGLRREAAAVAFALKLLAGQGRGILKRFVPEVVEPARLTRRSTRQLVEGPTLGPEPRLIL